MFLLFPQRPPQIPARRRQLFPCHSSPHSHFQHHQSHPHIVSRRPQSVLCRRHFRPARLHQDPHRPPLQLLIRHHCINHQVLINMSQPHHRRCTQHVQDHLLRRPRLQSRRPRQHLRSHLHLDRNLSKLCQRHVLVRRYRNRRRSASPRIFNRRQHIRCRSTRRNAHHHVSLSHLRVPQSSHAGVRRIFRAFHRPRHRWRSSRNERPHRLMRNPKRRRHFRRIQHAHSPARSRSDINQLPARAHRRNNRVHRPRNRRQLPLHRLRHLAILAVHQLHNLQRRHAVQRLRSRQPLLRPSLVFLFQAHPPIIEWHSLQSAPFSVSSV